MRTGRYKNMKAVIIGSKNISYEVFEKHLPPSVTEILWCGNNLLLLEYAGRKKIKLTSFDEKERLAVLTYADMIIAFLEDGDIATEAMIKHAEKHNIKIIVKAVNIEKTDS